MDDDFHTYDPILKILTIINRYKEINGYKRSIDFFPFIIEELEGNGILEGEELRRELDRAVLRGYIHMIKDGAYY